MAGTPPADLDADVLVIGSGFGGLGAALALARAGKRVVVLERHEVPGGCGQSFHVDGFRFSPGVHYVGDLHPGGLTRRLLEGLGVAADFFELQRDGYDRCLIGDSRLDYCVGRAALAARFGEAFPEETRGAAAVLEAVEALHAQLTHGVERHRVEQLTDWAAKARFFALAPVATLLEQWVSNPLCRAFLVAQAGNYGLPPSRAPLAVHALLQGHYFHGAWHPRGGGAGLVKALLKPFFAAGGTLLLDTAVDRVLVEGRRAIGVRLADGRELRARAVVSNADPLRTWSQLVGLEHAPPAVREKLATVRWSAPSVSLFLAVEADARAMGLDSGNLWVKTSNLEDAFRAATSPGAAWNEGELPFFLSVSTLKDPTHFDGRHHVLEVSTQLAWESFAPWAGSAPQARPVDYLRLKEHLAKRLLRSVERVVPGLTARVVAQAVGTPITHQRYVGATHGASYGVEKSRDWVGPNAFRIQGDLDGLSLCGASLLGQGVLGAALSGVAAAAGLLKVTLGEALSRREGRVRSWLADAPDTWPDEVRQSVARRQAFGRPTMAE